MTDRVMSATSYAGGIASVLSALTLTEWGIVVGILTALATFALNVWYQHRRDRREREVHALLMAKSAAARHEAGGGRE